tara:strand:- start:1715 stop:2650 length:936 start_codon:yes stop_codon:yes gene_type:complete
MKSKDLKKILENINCPICGSREYIVISSNKYGKIKNSKKLISLYKSSSENKIIDQLVECKKCNLEYLNPRIKESIIVSSYKSAIDKNHITQNIYRIETFYNSLKKLNKKLKLNNFLNLRGLDVGSASGSFLCATKKLNFKCIGIEPSIWLSKYGKKKYKVDLFQGTLDTFKVKSKFDIIFFWDVLEHLSNLNKTLKKVKKISRNKSLLVINIPDKNSFIAKVLGKKWPFYLNVHLYNFNKKSISALLKKYNYNLIQQFPHFQILSLGYVLKRASNYNMIFLYIYKFVNLLRLSDIPIKYNLGQTTFVFKNK